MRADHLFKSIKIPKEKEAAPMTQEEARTLVEKENIQLGEINTLESYYA